MESKFYQIMKLLSFHANHQEAYLIGLIFPESEVKEHLTDKLQIAISRSDFYQGIFWFYQNLNIPLQLQFDAWVEKSLEEETYNSDN